MKTDDEELRSAVSWLKYAKQLAAEYDGPDDKAWRDFYRQVVTEFVLAPDKSE